MPEFELPEIPAAIIAVLGLVTPWLLALVNQPHWSPLVKRLIAGHKHSPLADREVLVREETKAGEVTKRAARLSSIRAPRCMGAILY